MELVDLVKHRNPVIKRRISKGIGCIYLYRTEPKSQKRREADKIHKTVKPFKMKISEIESYPIWSNNGNNEYNKIQRGWRRKDESRG